MEKLNEFQAMWMQYPSESLVMEKAFSKTNAPNMNEDQRKWVQNAFHNTCCVRLSYSLNHTIGHKITKSHVRSVGLTSRDSVTGKNGKYIFRVTDMSTYINGRYGKADHAWPSDKKDSRDEFWKTISNKQGIILFHEKSEFLNGHADLWEKGDVKTYNLFDTATNIEFWEVTN